MANPKHIKILRQGVKAWNKWRQKYPKIIPDIEGADFRSTNLREANFSKTNCSFTHFISSNLAGANFCEADLSFASFNLSNVTRANFRKASFAGGCFTHAVLNRASFLEAEFSNTDFSNASLQNTNFTAAHLTGVNFYGAQLIKANFKNTFFQSVNLAEANLAGTNFEGATLLSVIFAANDLSLAKGLDLAFHASPSSIGVDTLYYSQGKIPERFLRDAGLPEGLIAYLPSLIGAVQPIQWHSCFISYSTKNQKFAERLHSRMRQAGLRVWFAPEDMKGGQYSDEQIDRAIQLHDRLLLVLSEDSIQSKWVEREIRKARKVERAEKRRKLFPITLTDYATLKKWECLDSDTGEDLAEEVRKYHIPDFSNWKNHDAFEKAFARLEKDLRTSIGK